MQEYVSMVENVCPICGKRFMTSIDRAWGWNWKGSMYCSYHCMRHVEIRYRVMKGMQKNTLWKADAMSDGARQMWDELLRLRHLTLAALSLQKAAYPKEWRAVEKKRAEVLERLSDAIRLLPDRLRQVVEWLYVDGRSTIDVLTTLDCDGDVLKAKLSSAAEMMSATMQRNTPAVHAVHQGVNGLQG